MKLNLKKTLGILFTFSVPILVSAQISTPTTFKEFIILLISIVQLAIPVVAALTMLVFFWGLAKFIFHADNEDKIEEGRKMMFWGVIAIFVMFSVWGLIAFLNNSVFSGGVGIPEIQPGGKAGTSQYQLR